MDICDSGLCEQTAQQVKRHMAAHGTDVRGGLLAVLRADPPLARRFGIDVSQLKGERMTTTNAGEELDQRVKDLMRRERIASYTQALELVLEDEPQLAAAYSEGNTAARQYETSAAGIGGSGVEDGDRQSAGAEIDLKAQELIRADSSLDYESAVSRVFEANPWLKAAYGRARA